ncbi:MAG: hypothetical protein OQL19_19365 [Gammaproteobacteria bacterium]|nr:hypothetical protein [Gammaproteobacteria bacterium]
MLNKIIFLLLFVFFTQTVLAGIDLHAGEKNNTADVSEHFIDKHSIVHCDTDKHQDEEFHQHSCHGHSTSFTFTNFSIPGLNFTRFSSTFPHVLSENSIILNTDHRPPIAS